MAKYRVTGVVKGFKDFGVIEADSVEEAKETIWDGDEVDLSVCHVCSDEISEPHIDELIVEED